MAALLPVIEADWQRDWVDHKADPVAVVKEKCLSLSRIEPKLPLHVARNLVTYYTKLQQKVKLGVPRNRPEGPEGGRGIALLFLDLGARRAGWSAPRPGHFTPGKDPVPIVQEAGWAPGPVWTCAKNIVPTGIRSADRPAGSQSLYRLSYSGPSSYLRLHITSNIKYF
jgi:hypothetical protein